MPVGVPAAVTAPHSTCTCESEVSAPSVGDDYEYNFGSEFGVDPRQDKAQGAAALHFALDCVFPDSDDVCREEIMAVHEMVSSMIHEPTEKGRDCLSLPRGLSAQ